MASHNVMPSAHPKVSMVMSTRSPSPFRLHPAHLAGHLKFSSDVCRRHSLEPGLWQSGPVSQERSSENMYRTDEMMQPCFRPLVLATLLLVTSFGPSSHLQPFVVVQALDLEYQLFREAEILHCLPDQTAWCQIVGSP